MPNVAQVLKEEIGRLARKEIRATCVILCASRSRP